MAKMKKKCLVYRGNEDCEGEFYVDARVYSRKKYCDKCKRSKDNDWHKKYQADKRAEEKLKKKK